MYMAFKHLHLTLVALTVLIFLVRAVFVLVWPAGVRKRWLKITAHAVDGLLILSAIALLVVMQMNPLHVGWVLAKIIALVAYIGFSVYAFKTAPTLPTRLVGVVLAGTTLAYIAMVAVRRTPTLGLF
ncbi:SirB2 family protein [Nitrincola schmidtii]|uniref:SirB2 family protein n=1 Tax=Nitrincola schmidtii TaxID=1730894 RepID=UPI00124E5CB1|nr:SirB2 family protein [Nitrincola schmidtii]